MENSDIILRALGREHLLSAREHGVLLLTNLEKKIIDDKAKNARLYNLIETSSAIEPSDDPRWMTDLYDTMDAANQKLKFVSKVLIQYLGESKKYMNTACHEQSLVLEKIIDELGISTSILSKTINNAKTGITYLQDERETFASKALSLAKSFRHICEEANQTITINSHLDYLSLINDIALSSQLNSKQVVDQVKFINSCIRILK
jgi:hypothetical protein